MSILMTETMRENLKEDLGKIQNNISIISALCKKEALEFIDKQIQESKQISKRLLVRFKLDDILSGATDLGIYEYCKRNNWSLYVQFNLHAKVYTLDKKICYMGSANATQNGLNVGKIGNIEMSKKFELDSEELMQIEKVFSEALLMNDKLFNKMKKQIESIECKVGTKHEWNREIIEKSIKEYNVLFQDDFPINDFPNNIIEEEVFLDISIDENIEEIKEKFSNTKIFQWLINVLEKQENKEIYFGELSSKIHNIIFQEPKQYRKDVKILQARLYNWIEVLNYEELKIDIPGRTFAAIKIDKIKKRAFLRHIFIIIFLSYFCL